MNRQWKMLLWSEWRQRRAQFFVCLGWMLLGAAYSVTHELVARLRAPVASFHATAMLYGLCVPIFLAMRTSLGELTDRTRAFHDGLPVSPQRRAWVRLAGGAAVFVIPIIIAGLIFSLCLATGLIHQAQERPPGEWTGQFRLPDRPNMDAAHAVAMVWRVAALAACAGTMLYLILSILGTALQTESALGFAGVAIAAVWFLGNGLQPELQSAGYPTLAAWITAIVPSSLVVNYGYGTEHGTYGDLVFAPKIFLPLLLNIMLQFVLAMIFVRRYSRKLGRRGARKRARGLPRTWRPWALPLPTRSIAIACLTLRQSVPMALPGLVLAFMMAPFQMEAVQWDSQAGYAERLTDILPSSMWIVGLLWATVVGAGIFSAELDRRVAEFWRAWPTSTAQLFAVKFCIGLAATLLVLDGSTIALTWNSSRWGGYYYMNWPYIAVIVPLHATMFAVAVAWTCLLRRPVIGGMAAFATFILLMVATDWSQVTERFNPIEVYNELNNMGPLDTHGSLDFSKHRYPLLATGMATTLIAAAIIGWRALRTYAAPAEITTRFFK